MKTVIQLLIAAFVIYTVHHASTPLELLELNPPLFGMQMISFDPNGAASIQQEYLFKEVQAKPELYGLFLTNLGLYLDSESPDTPKEQTLRYLALHNKLPQLDPLHLSFIQGFSILNLPKEETEEYKNEILKWLKDNANSNSSWHCFMAGFVLRELYLNKNADFLPSEYKDFESILKKSSAKKDTSAFFHFTLGNMYFHHYADSNPYKHLRMVVTEYEKARNLDPRNRNLFTEITSRYIQMHEQFQAKDMPEPFEFEELVYRRIILLEPRNPWAHNNLAYLYCQNNVHIREALKQAAIANKLEDNNPYFLDTMGWCLYRAGQLDKSIELLNKALSINNELADIHFHLATAYYDAGNLEAAVESYKKCLELEPEHALTMNNLAYLYSEMNTNIKEGLSMALKAIELSPNNSAFLDTVGWLYHKDGKDKEATDYLKQALELSPDSWETHEHLAVAYEKLGESELARQHEEKAKEIKEKESHVEVPIQADDPSTLPDSIVAITAKDAKELPYLLLLRTVEEAKKRYLELPNVPKTREAVKVFYDQLISLAQRKGDMGLLKKYADEFEKYNNPVATKEPEGTLKIKPSIPAVQSAKSDSSDIAFEQFFPKDGNAVVIINQKAMHAFLDQSIQSAQELQNSPTLQNLSFMAGQYLPEKLGIYYGIIPPVKQPSFYAIAKFPGNRAELFHHTISGLAGQTIGVPGHATQFTVTAIDDSTISIQSSQNDELFFSIRGSYILMSSTLLTFNKLPFSQTECIASNTRWIQDISKESPDALFFSNSLKTLISIFPEQFIDIFKSLWNTDEELFKTVNEFSSLISLEENNLVESEILYMDSEESAKELESKLKLIFDKMPKINQHLKIDYTVEKDPARLIIKTIISSPQDFFNSIIGEQLQDKLEHLND